MKGLTKRQSEVVHYIQQFISTNNYSPSYREIQRHFTFASLGSVYQYIKALKKKGVLESASFSARSLVPVEQIKSNQKALNWSSPLLVIFLLESP